MQTHANNKSICYNNHITNNNPTKGKTIMTHQQFQDILKIVQSLHLDFEDGIDDEQAYDMAVSIIADNPGLKEYINEHKRAVDAVGWLMCEM